MTVLASYVTHLNSSHAEVLTRDSVQLAHYALANYKMHRTNPMALSTFAEMLSGQAVPDSEFAFLRSLTPVKFFYDLDAYSVDTPSREDLDSRQRHYAAQILGMLHDLDGTAHVTASDIQCATRHGQVSVGQSKNKTAQFKASFRFFVQGVKTTMPVIKQAIEKAGLTGVFDMSVYSATRKMCMVFGIKNRNDIRCLLPTEDIESADFEPQRYLIQHVEDSWPEIHSKIQQQAVRRTPVIHRRNVPEPSVVLHHDSDMEDLASMQDSEMGEDLESPAAPDGEDTEGTSARADRLKELLTYYGFKNPRFVGNAACTTSGAECHNFDSENRDDCPLCHKAHESNMWFVKIQGKRYRPDDVEQTSRSRDAEESTPSVKRVVSISSHSTQCIGVDVFASPPLHEFTKLLCLGDRHTDYAKTYLAELGSSLEYSMAEGEWMTFTGSCWEVLNPIVLQSMVSKGLEKICVGEQVKAALLQHISSDYGLESSKKQLNLLRKVLKTAYQNVGSQGPLDAILKLMRTQCASAELYNQNPHLFHFKDGVYDLDLDLFRPTEVTDRNSFTCGYDYEPVGRDLEHDMIQVEDFYTRLMPYPDERHCLQKYFGLSLSGRTDVKYFGNLTDIRSGNNGKSTAVAFLKDTLGAGIYGYAAVTKKDMLYTSNGGSTEGASPYLLTLRGKRLASFEEMDASKKFSTDNIKEWSGGVPWDVSARTLYSKTMINFAFSAKILLCFNENRSPRYDVSDSAFIARMLVFPFR